MKKLKEKLLYSNVDQNDFMKFITLRNNIKFSKLKLTKWKNLRKYNYILLRNNASIPLDTKIGNNLTLPHGLSGIFISSGAEIGDNCVIFQQVTIGSNTLIDSKKIGSPKIGNNVYIGAGAKIIGNVNIGDNVRIGANAVVVFDVPDNCTVVGEKSRIIENKEVKDNKYYSYNDIETKERNN